MSKGRIEALSDGIFAITMTLLVLEIKVPELSLNASRFELQSKLRELGPYFYAYALTFVLSGAFWLFHHLTFHFIRHITRPLVWLNMVFLMFVALFAVLDGADGP